MLFVLEISDLGIAGKPSLGQNRREGFISPFLLMHPPLKTSFYVGSLDRNVHKNTQKSVHKYFWVNCSFICWSSLGSGALCEWGVDAGAVL